MRDYCASLETDRRRSLWSMEWEEDWDTSIDPLDWKSRMRSSPKRDSIVCVSDGNHF